MQSDRIINALDIWKEVGIKDQSDINSPIHLLEIVSNRATIIAYKHGNVEFNFHIVSVLFLRFSIQIIRMYKIME
jgi:hypothetical protein